MAMAGTNAVGPVSPPPMTMTCLPLTLIGFLTPCWTSLFCGSGFGCGVPLNSRPRHRQIAQLPNRRPESRHRNLLQLVGRDGLRGIVVDTGRNALLANDSSGS